MQFKDFLTIPIFSCPQINSEGIILYCLRRIGEEEERTRIMFYDGISSLRDAYGSSPKWHVRDSYLYLRSKTLTLRRIGSIEEKEIARGVISFDSRGGKIVIVKEGSEGGDLISSELGATDERGYLRGKRPIHRELISSKVRDSGRILEAAISERGDVAYVKLSGMRPPRSSLFINGEEIYSCQGFISELCWISSGLICKEYPLENGYFSKRKLIWIHGEEINEIELDGDPGCYLELDPPGHFDGKEIAPYGDSFLVIETLKGRGIVKRINPEKQEEEVIFSGDRTAYAVSASRKGIVIAWSSPKIPSAISLIRKGEEVEIIKGKELPIEVKEVGRDFEYGGGSKKAAYVHGGPRTSYGFCFNFEIFSMTTIGYRVLGINYPGSSGYEEGSFEEARKYVSSRLSEYSPKVAKGESFGSFLLASSIKGIGVKGIVLERGFYFPEFTRYCSDQGEILFRSVEPIKIEEIAENFPENVLIISGDRDFRCPSLESLALYNLLREKGKDPKMLVLSGSHLLREEKSQYLSLLSQILSFCSEIDHE